MLARPAQWATRETPLARIVRNSGWLFSGKLVAALLSFFYLALATRTLGLQGFGIFIMIVTTAQFIASVLSFDSWQAVVKYGQAPLVSGDKRGLGRLAGLCMAIDLTAGLVGVCVAATILFLFNDSIGLSDESRGVALIYAATVLLAVRSTAVGLLRLNDKFAAGAISDTMSSVTRMAGATLAALFKPDVTGFLIGWAASEIIVATTYWAMVYRHCGHLMERPQLASVRKVAPEYPGLFRFLFASNFNMTLKTLMTQGPILLVGAFAGVAQAGLYRLAAQLAGALALVAQMISRSIFTEMARNKGRATSQVEHSELYATLSHTLRLAAIGSVIIALLLTLAGEAFLLLMAGPAFAGAYPMLLLLGFSAVVDFAGVSFVPLLLATDRARWAVTIQVVGLVILAALLSLLLPASGAQGAALAVLLVSIFQFIALGWAVRIAARQDKAGA